MMVIKVRTFAALPRDLRGPRLLWQLRRYELQQLATQRRNRCYLIAAFRRLKRPRYATLECLKPNLVGRLLR